MSCDAHDICVHFCYFNVLATFLSDKTTVKFRASTPTCGNILRPCNFTANVKLGRHFGKAPLPSPPSARALIKHSVQATRACQIQFTKRSFRGFSLSLSLFVGVASLATRQLAVCHLQFANHWPTAECCELSFCVRLGGVFRWF